MKAWPAPAKINLFLHVVGRRPDGYHELQTAFQILDCCDLVSVRVRADGQVVRSRETPGVAAGDDLLVRAARLLREQAGVRAGAELGVRKRVPMGAGLGGGSSDAATVLVALNRLWGVNLPAGELAALGARLGADVPVFVIGRSAFAEGIGERLRSLALADTWYAVVVPPCVVPTARIFAQPQLTRDTPKIKIESFLLENDPGRSQPSARSLAQALLEGTRNDCEAVTRQLYPEVDQALSWLGRHAPARMTGTGSGVFAAFAERGAARAAVRGLPAGWRSLVARGVERSALHARLEALDRANIGV